MYYAYVLKSINFCKTYVGYTTDLGKRLKEHNSGMSKFTRRFKPWDLIYYECFLSLTEAIKREKYFKSAAGRRWMKKNLFGNS